MAVSCAVLPVVTRGQAFRPFSRVVTVRAQEERSSNHSIIFYGGSSYTDVEWKEAFRAGTFKSPPPITGEVAFPSGEVATIRSLMAFDGPAPELINGRLAMVGFFAALCAEIASGEGVIMQFIDAPGAVLVTFSLVLAATLNHLFKDTTPECRQLGPLTAAAERLSGRAAMIGLLLLTVSENFTDGRALL